MWEELEQIRVQALTPSLVSIKEDFEGKGITYRDNGTSVAADLTAAQIHDIAELSAVSAVFEEVTFIAMDGGGALQERSSVPNGIDTASTKLYNTGASPSEGKKNKSTSYFLPIIMIVAVSATALLAYRRNIKRAD